MGKSQSAGGGSAPACRQLSVLQAKGRGSPGSLVGGAHMTPASSSVEPSEGRVSPELLSLTQSLAHNRGFIIICQISEEFSQPTPTGVGGAWPAEAPTPTSQAAWLRLECVLPPAQGTPKAGCRGGGESGGKAWRDDASFLPTPLSPQTPTPTQSPAWARVQVRHGNWGRVTSSPRDWWGLRQRAGQRGGCSGLLRGTYE